MHDAAHHYAAFLRALGLDLDGDPELAETPARVTALLQHWVGERPPPPPLERIPAGTAAGQRVVVRDIPFHAICVHHMVPFFGTVHVAYLPDQAIVGFGTVGRVVEAFSRQPQLQERMTAQIAQHLHVGLSLRACCVVVEARQLCMEMTGSTPAGRTLTIHTTGDWQGDGGARIVSDLLQPSGR